MKYFLNVFIGSFSEWIYEGEISHERWLRIWIPLLLDFEIYQKSLRCTRDIEMFLFNFVEKLDRDNDMDQPKASSHSAAVPPSQE